MNDTENNNMTSGNMMMCLNSITPTDDPTITEAIFVVHDFDVSGNMDIISESLSREYMSTLINKPIVLKYITKDENFGIDGLTDHEDTVDTDRDTGEEIQYQDTIAVGTIISTWIGEGKKSNGETGNVLYCKANMWNDKYHNVVALLKEWMDKGVKISCSVEYLFCNYRKINNVREILAPIIYTGLCVLNSEERGMLPKVDPSYESSFIVSLNSAIDKDMNKNKNSIREGDNVKKENKFLKNMNELSHGDIRSKIYNELADAMTANEYYEVYIPEWFVFDDYFIYETYVDNKYVYFKIAYQKTEDDVILDYENRVQVVRDDVWVEVTKVTEMGKSLNQKDLKIKELESDMASKAEETVKLKSTIKSLNSKIGELEPYKEQVDKEQYEKALNEIKENYKEKFEKLDALHVFNSKEVQTDIEKCLNSETKVEAELSIKTKLCDLITNLNTKQARQEDQKEVVELGKSLNSLKQKDKFKENYGFEC